MQAQYSRTVYTGTAMVYLHIRDVQFSLMLISLTMIYKRREYVKNNFNVICISYLHYRQYFSI